MVDARTPGFRTRPPAAQHDAIPRVRLLDCLRRRFDHRLTVVVAGAGYGKTTLLAQAVAENRLDPLGVDAWLSVGQQDRSPVQLVAGMAAALSDEADVAAAETLDGVIDLAVLRSPESVSLVLDDVHHLDGSDAWAVVGELLERLPANGHLVLGSRTMPALGVRRLQAAGVALVLDERSLRFTPDELDEVAARAGLEPGAARLLPPWPALAVLSSTVGHEASIEFVWDEILATLPSERRRALALVAPFERIDDDLVRAVAGEEWSATGLVAGLPLVDSDDGRYRLHDLWREALGAARRPEEWRSALLAGAEVLLDRGELVPALRCFRDAGVEDRLLACVRSFASRSISAGLDRVEAEAVLDLLTAEQRQGPLGLAVRAILDWNEGLEERLAAFSDAAAAAGDDELRALAAWRQVQRRASVDPTSLQVSAELTELADDGWPLARAAVALIRSHEGEARGDVAAALAPLDDFAAPDPRARRSAVDSRYVAMGHPEAVTVTLEEVLTDGASEPVSAQAVWLRGDIDPDDAWPIAATLPTTYGRRRMVDVQVPLLGIVTSVGLAAGAVAEARALADEALRLAPQTIPRLRLFAQVADALVTLADVGESQAVTRFEAALAEAPLAPWPPWAYLGALAPLRALLPGTEWLDGAALGPSLRLAVEAGRTVRELRAGAPPTLAAELPWHDLRLLRVHVPPSLLVELAVAAAAAAPGGLAAVPDLPGRSTYLRRLLDHPNPAVREAAADLAARAPARPGYDLRVVTLGDLRVERSDGVPVPRLDARARVRQLLALLVADRVTTRAGLAARMWPHLDAEAAANNLRVTLHKLLSLLEPERDPPGSWWVRSAGERIELVGEGLVVDVEEFDRHLLEARRAEQHGAPSEAVQHYEAMGRLHGGEFLPDVTDESVLPERTRLQSLAYGAACRLAELRLAQGEPEVALQHAVAAERIDPLGERAPRVLVRCHLALGARSAALETIDLLRARLSERGADPEPETAALIRRVV